MSGLVLLAIIAASGGDRYHATELYCTRNADTPGNTLFSGRLVDAIYERAVSFPVWDRAGGGQAISYLELVNIDGALDSWLSEAWKDVRVTLKIVERRAAYSTAVQVGVCVVERIEAPSNDRVRLVCRSVFERLEKTITTSYLSTVTNEAAQSNAKPLTFGEVRWLDPVNSTLNNSASTQRGVYDVADDYFEGIVELRQRGALQDASTTPLVTNASPQYFEVQQEGFGFLLREQSYRLAGHIRGQLRRVTQMFVADTLTTLTGWTVSVAGGSSITLVSSGIVDLVGDNDTCRLSQTLTTVAGAVYQIEVVIDNTTNSGLDLYAGTSLRRVEDITTRTICASFVASGSSTVVGVDIPTSRNATARITRLRCYACERIDTLTEIIRFAGVTRGTLSTGDIDLTALEAIDEATDYQIGFHSNGGEVRGIDLVSLAAQSFGVAIFQDANGKLAPVQIAEPAVTADFELDELSILEISYEADEAPGLSTRMYWGRNYAPHSADDTAGLTPTTTTIAQLVADLKNEVKTVTTAKTLHAVYAEAATREPLNSLLSRESGAQLEIDRICSLYGTPRAFYSVKAFVEAGSTYTIEPGKTVKVTHSRYGLSAGVNLLCIAARSDFLGNAIDLVLWG